MTTSDQNPPVAEDIDVQALGRALWRAKGWILGLAIGAGIVTFIALSMMRPLYTSEARILIQNDQSSFTRPADDEGRNLQQRVLDEQAVQSQVQVITSRDLAVEVIKALDLTNNAAFAEDAGVSVVGRFMRRLGLGRGSAKSEEEKAANTFAEHLSVFPLAKSSVIAVDYTSGELRPRCQHRQQARRRLYRLAARGDARADQGRDGLAQRPDRGAAPESG